MRLRYCVDQYLKNEDLHDPPDNAANPWVAFLKEHPKLQGNLYWLYTDILFKTKLRQLHEPCSNIIDTLW